MERKGEIPEGAENFKFADQAEAEQTNKGSDESVQADTTPAANPEQSRELDLHEGSKVYHFKERFGYEEKFDDYSHFNGMIEEQFSSKQQIPEGKSSFEDVVDILAKNPIGSNADRVKQIIIKTCENRIKAFTEDGVDFNGQPQEAARGITTAMEKIRNMPPDAIQKQLAMIEKVVASFGLGAEMQKAVDSIKYTVTKEELEKDAIASKKERGSEQQNNPEDISLIKSFAQEFQARYGEQNNIQFNSMTNFNAEIGGKYCSLNEVIGAIDRNPGNSLAEQVKKIITQTCENRLRSYTEDDVDTDGSVVSRDKKDRHTVKSRIAVQGAENMRKQLGMMEKITKTFGLDGDDHIRIDRAKDAARNEYYKLRELPL
jgi:hypothetical protein